MNLPERRKGIFGTPDVGSHVIGRKLNARKPFERLRRNRRLTRSWRILDSFGETICKTSDLPTTGYEMQGRGAMVSLDLEERFALVACNADFAPNRLRGFIERRALPLDLARIVDNYWAGAGRGEPRYGPRGPLLDPGFGLEDRFEGEDGLRRTYWTYNAHAGGAIYFCVNTTGVHGGGIVRGLARVGQGVVEVDRMRAPDSNGKARWRYVRFPGTRLGGWMACQ